MKTAKAVVQTKTDQLREYFKSIEENIKGSPFVIAYGYIFGALLQCRDTELKKIAIEHFTKCKAICDEGEIYRCLVDSGSDDVKEVPLIKLADRQKITCG